MVGHECVTFLIRGHLSKREGVNCVDIGGKSLPEGMAYAKVNGKKTIKAGV